MPQTPRIPQGDEGEHRSEGDPDPRDLLSRAPAAAKIFDILPPPIAMVTVVHCASRGSRVWAVWDMAYLQGLRDEKHIIISILKLALVFFTSPLLAGDRNFL